jgi:GDPmannose 4,6-dehydratase
MAALKSALITGITGQDGSYLAELLLEKGYEVHGIKRRTSLFNTARIDHLYSDPLLNSTKFFLHHGDLSDTSSLVRTLNDVRPSEIYNLGAQSHVGVSFEEPEYTADSDALGTLRMLEAMRILGLKDTKFYQASTSEIFGNSGTEYQNEQTPFRPQSPYATAKLYAYWTTVNYREAYNLFACNGILFNHESPRRGETFVSKKIVQGLIRVKNNTQDRLILGNLNAKRDWGHAKEFVEAMWKMLQLSAPQDLVIATGHNYSVREIVEKVYSLLGGRLSWNGVNENEVGLDSETGKIVVAVNKIYYRPNELHSLKGDFSLARELLDWSPKIQIDSLLSEMVSHEFKVMGN